MVANSQEGEIMGVVFLYRIFETITEHNNQISSLIRNPKEAAPVES